jgi:hypothetical protein
MPCPKIFFLNWCEMWLRYSELYENIKGSSFDFCMLPYHANHDHCFLYDLLSQISGLVNCFYVYLLIFMRHLPVSMFICLFLCAMYCRRKGFSESEINLLREVSWTGIYIRLPVMVWWMSLWLSSWLYKSLVRMVFLYTYISCYKNYSIQALASVCRI